MILSNFSQNYCIQFIQKLQYAFFFNNLNDTIFLLILCVNSETGSRDIFFEDMISLLHFVLFYIIHTLTSPAMIILQYKRSIQR